METDAQSQIAAANQAVEQSQQGAGDEPDTITNAPTGTVVQMRSGGPLMTITGRTEVGLCECQYWSAVKGEFITQMFKEDLMIAWWNPDINKSVNSLLKIRESDNRWRSSLRS